MYSDRIYLPKAPGNILFDIKSNRITPLLDYDFSCIQHPSYEFLCSFSGGLGGQFRARSAVEGSEQTALMNAKLRGFPSPLPTLAHQGDGEIDWQTAKAWEEALEEVGAKRPKTIPGIEGLRKLTGCCAQSCRYSYLILISFAFKLKK